MLDRGRAINHLKQARRMPRCVHIKPDGVQCGSPALKDCAYCFAHARLAMRHPHNLSIPFLEDANSVQSAIMEVMRALLDGELDRRTAGLLLYGLQMASCNLKYVCFEPKDPRTVVRDTSNLQPYCDFADDEPEEAQPEQATPMVATESGPESSASRMTAHDSGLPVTPHAEPETCASADFPITGSPDHQITRSVPGVPHRTGIKSAGEMLNAITELHRLGKAVADAEKLGIST